jgi:hypothetical protein
MLGHASIQQTQRYLNVTDEELRRGLEVSWSQRGRPLRLAPDADGWNDARPAGNGKATISRGFQCC